MPTPDNTPEVEDILLRFPNLDGLSSEAIEFEIDFAVRLLDHGAWGDLWFDAVCFLVAHEIAMKMQANSDPSGMGTGSGVVGTTGPVSSVSAAGVSISFQGAADIVTGHNSAWYSRTIYGQQYLRLAQTVFPVGVLSA